MILGELIYVVINPETREVLGDGECPAIYSSEPTKEDVRHVSVVSGCKAEVVRCRIVLAKLEEVSP